MEDVGIVELLFRRSDEAITELDTKYGKVSRRVSENITGNRQDAEECVNDAYLGVWNAIPPARPSPLRTFVLRLVRNISVTRFHANSAQKRMGNYGAALDELEECLASPVSVEDEITAGELTEILDRFLDGLDRESRVIFVRRYWFADSAEDIAKRLGLSANNVAVRLSRTREKLRKILRKEGYVV